MIDPSTIEAALASWQLNLRVAGLAKVTAYDASARTCKALPLVRRPVETELGELVYEDQPEVQNVMVHAFGGGQLTLTTPLQSGDVALLVYLDFSPALWRKNGAVSDPPDAQQNGPSYPVAIPFYRPGGQAGEDSDASIGKPGGLRLHFGASTIDAGNGADFVAMSTKVSADLAALQAMLAAFFSAMAGDAALSAVAPATYAAAGVLNGALAAWPSPAGVASSNLRADG
jgi:hypothetical protein